MASDLQRKNQSIISEIAEAIKNHEPAQEFICELFIRTRSFGREVERWRHPATGLNLLQYAIICKHADVVKYLLEEKHDFVLLQCTKSSNSLLDGSNSALHLACKVGSLDIIQYLIEDVKYCLQEQCAVTIDRDHNGQWIRIDPNTVEKKKPLQICVDERHVVCANFICGKRLSAHHPIHSACYMGYVEYLQLLLSIPQYQKNIRAKDTSGRTPVHIASACAEPECLRILLENGSSANETNNHKTCLYYLYNTQQRVYKYWHVNVARCTKILLEYGIRADRKDHNSNTPLDFLCKCLAELKWTTTNSTVRELFTDDGDDELQMDSTYSEVNKQSREIVESMRALLQGGALTMVLSSDGETVDHTVMHTLLRVSAKLLHIGNRNFAKELYDIMNMFFEYGHDPNVIGKNNNTSSFVLFLVKFLVQYIPEDKWFQFVELFVMNGADVDRIVPRPVRISEELVHRQWDVFPVMMALSDFLPMDIIEFLQNSMSQQAYNCYVMETKHHRMWWHMTFTPYNHMPLSGPNRKEYEKQWLKMVRQKQPRTLKHTCKLAILVSLGRRSKLVTRLPLPPSVKDYITSSNF
jgi:hypothetical protein